MSYSDFEHLKAKVPTDFMNQEIIESIRAQNNRKIQAMDSTNFLAEFQKLNLASEFAKQLFSRIKKFDLELDSEHEVGIRLVSFGQTITFHVSDIGYYNPSLIIFSGITEDGNSVELLQHTSQISFLLIALKKVNPEHPKRPIGFIKEE